MCAMKQGAGWPARALARRSRSGLVACALGLLVLALAPAAASASTLVRGFADSVYFNAGSKTWVKRTVAAGAQRVSLEIDWAAVEPKKPKPGTDASSPSNPAYNFLYVDNVVKEFAKTGVQPVLLVTDAPRWAEANGGTRTEEVDGSYKPNAKAFRQLAQALATRYSGRYTDPASVRYTYTYTYTYSHGHRHSHRHRHEHSKKLPHVQYFQAWAEANLGVHLSPQWTVARRAYVNTGAQLYRGLLNSFYAGIKRGDRHSTVITAGLAPYGDPPGGSRTPPVQFLRNLLCLSRAGKRESCSESTAHFDVIASDPYEVGSPTTLAEVANDASAPDLGKLVTVVNQALKAGTVLPRVHKDLWVTEFSYDSKPPNPTAVSTATQARWLEEAFYVFWREHVSTAIWYLIRDETGKVATHYFSGVYFYDGKSKPSLVAYRFPFVVMKNPLVLGTVNSVKGAPISKPATTKTATVWGIAPVTGSVHVELRVGHGWKTLFSTHVDAGHVFVRNVPAGQTGYFRAVVSGQKSLVWKY
jgi:hypothetical protein